MQLRFASFAVINLREDLHLRECAHAGRTMKKPTRGSAFFVSAQNPDQPKFLATKSQFTSFARKVSTNLGRRLR